MVLNQKILHLKRIGAIEEDLLDIIKSINFRNGKNKFQKPNERRH